MKIPGNPGRGKVPKVQAPKFTVKDAAGRRIQAERMAAVKANFMHAWNGYRNHAWLKDEVSPLSGGFHDAFGGWEATLVDALGTLWIMDMKEEFKEAVASVIKIDFSTCALEEINVFETTIRYLGGFLSAYDLSGEQVLLDKAIELGEMLYHAFDTPNRMPITRWKFKEARDGTQQEASDFVLVAEIGSLSLEFTRLGQLTGNPKYDDAIQRVMSIFEQQQSKTHLPGMWPIGVNARDADFTAYSDFTLGGMANSVYEYLPKQHLLMNGANSQYKKMYQSAMDAIKGTVLYRPMTPDQRDMLLAGQVHAEGGKAVSDLTPEPQAQHLACFAGGMVGLGAKLFSSEDDLLIAKKLVEGCLWAYESATLGIMPETIHVVPCPINDGTCAWDERMWHDAVTASHPEHEGVQAEDIIKMRHLPPGVSKIDDGRYILRPEAIESVFYLYRITGDTSLLDRAWRMFENIVVHTTTDIAHAALADCTTPKPVMQDSMESFWLAETLRYFYLIFADEDLISLDEYVLNTEAHPLRRPG